MNRSAQPDRPARGSTVRSGSDLAVMRLLEHTWTTITDITHIPNLYPEITSAVWLDGIDRPQVGARFLCHHVDGNNQWTTLWEIVDYDKPRTIAWTLQRQGKPLAKCRFTLRTNGDKVLLSQTIGLAEENI